MIVWDLKLIVSPIAANERGKPHSALRWTGRKRKTALPAFQRETHLLLAFFYRETKFFLTAFHRETFPHLTATDQVSHSANHPIIFSSIDKEEKDASGQHQKQSDENNGQILWRIWHPLTWSHFEGEKYHMVLSFIYLTLFAQLAQFLQGLEYSDMVEIIW